MEWLLKAPKPPAIPKIADADSVTNPIDAFVLAKLESKQMHPAPPADRRILIRRALSTFSEFRHLRRSSCLLADRDPQAWPK